MKERLTDASAIVMERTEEEKARRRACGDKGAKYSKGKQWVVQAPVIGCITCSPCKDNIIAEIYED